VVVTAPALPCRGEAGAVSSGMRVASCFVSLMLISGCGLEPPSGDGVIPVLIGDAWSGGEVRLVAEGITTAAVPWLVVGSDTVPLMQLDSVTLVGVLPDTSGTLLVRLPSGASPGSIRVHGFEGIDRGPPLHGPMTIWPAAGRPTVLALNGDSLLAYDIQTGLQQLMLPKGLASQFCVVPPTVSLPDSRVVLASVALPAGGGCGPVTSWQLTPGSPAAVDSFVAGNCASVWLSLAPGRLLEANHNSLFLHDRAAGFSILISNAVTQAVDFVVSPDHRFAVPIMGAASRLPIVDTRTASLSATLQNVDLPFYFPAAFTDSVTFLVGARDSAGPALLEVNAQTGVIGRRVRLDSLALAIATSTDTKQVFVLERTSIPQLRVLDRVSLTTIAMLRTRSTAFAALRPAVNGWQNLGVFQIVEGSATGTLYLTVSSGLQSCVPLAPSFPLIVARYSLLP
jgi:hypothetical protein